MRSLEKDYRYLLLKLVPYHRLDRERRRDISRALASEDFAMMRRVAVGALDDLCSSGHFSRTRTVVENGRSLLTYVPRSGNFQLRLQVPTAELAQVPSPVTGGTAPPEVTVDIIPQIIRSLRVTAASIMDRLEATVTLLPNWFGMVAARLTLVEERIDEDLDGDLLSTAPEATILKQAAAAHCRRSGQPEFLHPEAALALGMTRPQLVNRSAGVPGQVAVTPVFCDGEFWGILELWLAGDGDGAEERSRVEVATQTIAQIIENAVHIETLTSTDKLTKLYNRNFYDSQLPIEIERAKRSGTSLTMLVADIDDFKSINDECGHAVGDEAMRMIADSIRSNLRRIDLAFRYGGEEFVMLLPGTAQIEAIHTAERVRSVIEKLPDLRAKSGDLMPLRVSIGGAVYPHDAGGAQELFNKADQALYRAKERGKNRVEFYSDS